MNLKPLEFKLPNNEVTRNIAKIFDRNNVVSIENTVLDPDFIENGGYIDLPVEVVTEFTELSRIYIPPFPIYENEDIIVLHEVAIKANNITRVSELVRDGEKSEEALQKSISVYNEVLMTFIFGKNGIISRDIIGRRMPNSGRAVLLPSIDPDQSIVYIPSSIMRNISATEGDYIIVGRDPAIWDGSLEVLVAKTSPDQTIKIHPLVFAQFGADCDGDTVWVHKPDQCHKKLLAPMVLEKTKRQHSHLDLDHSHDLNPGITGFSISPVDVINKDKTTFSAFQELTGKDVLDEAYLIASGLEDDAFENYLTTINQTMLIQKIYLGPLGAASQRLRLIATRLPILGDAANYVSERSQQMLFDIKGSITSDDQKLIVFLELLDILNIANSYSSIENLVTHSMVIDRLEEFGFDRSTISPLIIYLYTYYPLRLVLSSIVKIDDDIEKTIYKLLTGESSTSDCIVELATMGIDIKKLISSVRAAKANTSLSSILADPVFAAISTMGDTKVQVVEYIENLISSDASASNSFLADIIVKNGDKR
jgi:hypothetical protein